MLQRAKERAGIAIGDQCQKCFDEYCWDGSVNTTANAYDPVLKMDNGTFSTDGQAGVSKSGAIKLVNMAAMGSVITIILSGFILM